MAGDHKCPVCQATFTRPQHVARHMRSHTGDRPYKCQHCGDQFARSDLLARHINKCHASERPPTTTAPNQRRKGNSAASRATTSKQACDQCVQSSLPCDGANPCSKCIQRKYRCTYVKFHRQTAPSGPGHLPPPRPDTEVGLGNSLYAPAVAGRYAQAPPHDDFAYSHGTLATQPTSGLYPSQYSFNPSLSSYAQQQPPSATDHHHSNNHNNEPLDFASRYRQQAEFLRRAGVIPPPSVHDANSLQPAVGVPPYSGAYATNGSWADDGARKDVEHFDQYSYLDPARQQYLRPQQQQQPQPHPQQLPPMQSYAPDMHNNGYYGHGRSTSDSWNNHHARRASFAESDGSSVGGHSSVSSSATSSTGNNLPLDLASHPRGGYAPPTLPVTSANDSSRPSTASGPSNASGHARTVSESGHDGFSSAFGLMSIDDPAVLAGIAPDAQPFFSGMGLTTPTPAKEREARDRYASMFSMAGPPGSSRDPRDGGVKEEPTLAGLTPREAETRELREFWRAYMRTPLTGGGPLGGPTPTTSGNMLGAAPNDTDAPRPSLAGKRGLSRVASLPSVKSPAREHAQYAPGNMMPPAQRGGYASGNADDLRSYEQAVLSRRAPMNLNLVPKRARAGSSAIIGGYDDGHTSSASPPSQNAISMPPRPSTANAYHPTAYTYDPSARGTSTTASTDDGSGNSSDPERGAGRPNFKRLASQTLGPDHTKAARYASYDGGDGSALDADDGLSDGSDFQRVPRMMASAAERQRRLSAPSTNMLPPSLNGSAEATYA